MKLLFFAVLCVLLLSGCMAVAKSNIGLKILEGKREIDAALLHLAVDFYQDERFVYLKAPVQAFRESHTGASIVVGNGNFADLYSYYPLAPVRKRSVVLRRSKNGRWGWNSWRVVPELPEKAQAMPKPEKWFKADPSRKSLDRYRLVNVAERDHNSVWRKTAAYSCMILLDFPLSVVYTCSGGILAFPALCLIR